MGAFVDSDFREAQESQLTLGTTSLLSIFFGLALVCGLFFGLGYSLGRRGMSQLANLKPPAIPAPAAQPIAPAKTVIVAPAIAPEQPLLIAQVESASLPAPMLLPARRSPQPVFHAIPQAAPLNTSATVARVPVATLLATKQFLPKPSAIQPVTVQPNADLNGPIPWKWTPPFDVHHGDMHPKLARPRVLRTGVSHPVESGGAMDTAAIDDTKISPLSHSALTVQIAALSRQDDAQVLADALRKRGFFASIHNGNEDSLYHVQVGPFERRIALATQQRLIAKGYNAVVK
jgi:DedD protein